MSSFGKKFLSAFVEVSDDKNADQVTVDEPVAKSAFIASTPQHSDANSKFSEYFNKLIAEANFPGPDYYEFTKMTEAMQGMQEAAKGFTGGSAVAADPAKQAEGARKGFEKTLAGMKELAEMVRAAQSDAMAHITQRATQQMQDIKVLTQPK